MTERDAQVSLRFVDGRRVGCAATNRLDDEALRRLADGRPPSPGCSPSRRRPSSCPSRPDRAWCAGASSPATARRFAGVARGGRARGHRRRRCGRCPGLRLVHHLGRAHRRRQQPGRATSSRSAPPPRSSRSPWAATARPATPRRRPSTCTDIDAAAIGREAAERARDSRGAGGHRARRLPGRARAIRGGRPAGDARLRRLLRPRRPGGPLVPRAGTGRRLGARDHRRRRDRSGRRARLVRLRGRAPRSA